MSDTEITINERTKFSTDIKGVYTIISVIIAILTGFSAWSAVNTYRLASVEKKQEQDANQLKDVLDAVNKVDGKVSNIEGYLKALQESR